MHTCLAIPEIFHLICDELRLGNITRHPPSDLASLARTCRALSEIALNSLWHRINNIGPLIKCMPRDLWEIDDGRRLVLKRPLKHSDIHILHGYAHRVRYFQFGHSSHSLAGVYQALSLCSYDHILPKLEQLVWYTNDAEAFPYLRFFLSPTLKALDILIDMRHREQIGCLNTISMLSPAISKLTITLHRCIIFSANDPLVGGVSAWRNLSDLELFCAPFHDLLCTAQLPKLKRLSITIATISVRSLLVPSQLQLNPLHVPQPCYPALESLALSNLPSVAIAVQFVEVLQSARLSSLKLGSEAFNITPSHLHDLFSILSQHCNPSSLKVFHFTSRRSALVFSGLVSTLFVFSKLKEVRLRFASPMEFPEEWMSQIASAWPDLEVLEATGIDSVASASHSQNTLSCLVPLASGCPKLRRLHIWIDASDEATRRALRADPGRTKGVQNWALRHLDVRDSPISHKEFVASFLSDIFPNLEDISPKFCGMGYEVDVTEDRNARRWQYVAQVLLPMLSRARVRDYERLGVARPETAPMHPVVFEHSSRRYAEMIEENDGEWSDPEQLVFGGRYN